MTSPEINQSIDTIRALTEQKAASYEALRNAQGEIHRIDGLINDEKEKADCSHRRIGQANLCRPWSIDCDLPGSRQGLFDGVTTITET